MCDAEPVCSGFKIDKGFKATNRMSEGQPLLPAVELPALDLRSVITVCFVTDRGLWGVVGVKRGYVGLRWN